MASSAVMVPETKRYLQSKYNEMLKMASDEQFMESVEDGNFSFNKLRLMIQKHWVMAETSSPQFVIARSVTCTASGVICMLAALALLEAEIRLVVQYMNCKLTASKYDWSIKWILLSQSIGVAVGSIAPTLRFFTAIKLKCCKNGKWRTMDEFKVESYWTRKLIKWKESSFPLQIRNRRWRRILHKTKGLILSILVRVQILVVRSSKVVQFISFCFAIPIFKTLKHLSGPSRVHGIPESTLDVDLSRYVLLLEGESRLPQKVQSSILNEVDKLIETGKKQQPKNLISLLHKVGNFKGLREVDKNQIPSLHSQEPPKCWSLPLVTLTSVAIALPKIPKQEINWLLQSVDEGLYYVKLIEKSMDNDRNLANSINAADVSWVGVELYLKWLDNDLHETSLKGKNSKEILEELSSKAEKTIVEFKKDVKDSLMENPLNWPVNAIAANSMYRTCQRLLRAYDGDHLRMDEGLFQQICNMIANIMAACLTNVTHVIIMKCHQKSMKDKEESVRQAALLLGETEEILQILEIHRGTRSDSDVSEFVDKWCNLIKRTQSQFFQ
ncbi:uncharacterized protein LOC127255148 [Andrographis paniculata]|uniref:uncharacterized protein LOC127255148 n=1 Tax=Andrographis paniculata TaxID=175694 RepID=UPI0021E8B531|nr:uncharacterized protein LOC127255148 [Andrographis paniculata]